MNIIDFNRKKEEKRKITILTCYDYPSALTIAESSIDCVLVGDSVAMVVHGYPNTIMATMDMMVLHTMAVARGLKTQLLIADLPFLSYRISKEDTMQNVRRLLQAGAQAVKLEGASPLISETIRCLVDAGIPVMGHIGLTPQFIHQLGGYKIQGKKDAEAKKLIEDAIALEKAGCFAIVIECVPEALAAEMTKTLSIPTIGIGAGIQTDGQVLVWHDVLGLQQDLYPRFVKRYAEGKTLFLNAINAYVEEIHNARFPAKEHAF